ncbi:MAG: hypothetical protein EOO73_26625 [Myxococcales bacterium]|nr:MAG: hypothetical protein EOO73_26625 [Myxococcales bacterium]
MGSRKTGLSAILSVVCWAVVGCASAPKPATTAANSPSEAAPAASPAPSPKAVPAEGKAAEPVKESPKPAEDARDGLRKASRPPMDLLTGNNVVYVFNFSGSAKGETAKAQCESEGDPASVRGCLAKEREKIPVESVRFVKDAHGQFWWVTYNRYKGNLLKWHKVQFMPGKEDADTISLSLVGKDKGIAPMPRVPAALKVELPNDYSIVISDPEHGDMMFDAKIGLMDPEPPN